MSEPAGRQSSYPLWQAWGFQRLASSAWVQGDGVAAVDKTYALCKVLFVRTDVDCSGRLFSEKEKKTNTDKDFWLSQCVAEFTCDWRKCAAWWRITWTAVQILLNRSGVNIWSVNIPVLMLVGKFVIKTKWFKSIFRLMVTNICMGCCLAEFGRPNKVQPLLNQTDGSHDLLLIVNLWPGSKRVAGWGYQLLVMRPASDGK